MSVTNEKLFSLSVESVVQEMRMRCTEYFTVTALFRKRHSLNKGRRLFPSDLTVYSYKINQPKPWGKIIFQSQSDDNASQDRYFMNIYFTFIHGLVFFNYFKGLVLLLIVIHFLFFFRNLYSNSLTAIPGRLYSNLTNLEKLYVTYRMNERTNYTNLSSNRGRSSDIISTSHV